MDRVTIRVMVGMLAGLAGVAWLSLPTPGRYCDFRPEHRVPRGLIELEAAVVLFHGEFGYLPPSVQALRDEGPPFLGGKGVDPWGREYFYAPSADGQSFTLASWGADGEPGGCGEDEDWIWIRFAKS